MAQVTDPIGHGTLGGILTIDANGQARVYTKPRDPKTPQQLAYRQLMRGLNDVLLHFSDPVDADLRELASPAWRWSSHTFQHWAASHGAAIHEDLPYYGASHH